MAADRLQSIETVARVLGVDVTYLQPDGEDHFDPFSVVSNVSAILLVSFLEGLKEAPAREAGRFVGRQIAARLEELWSKRKGVGETEVASAADATATVSEGDRAGLDARSVEVEVDLSSWLNDQGMPGETAREVAVAVRGEALQQVTVRLKR